MPKLKEILEEDTRKSREAKEARAIEEETGRQREIENIALFAKNLQPFLTYLAENSEVFAVIEDLQVLIKSRQDIPKVERLVISDVADQWTLIEQEEWEEDKRNDEWWKDLSNPRKWHYRYDYMVGTEPVQAMGLRVSWGHYVHQGAEEAGTEGWSRFVDVVLRRNSSRNNSHELAVRYGKLDTELRIGEVLREVKIENSALLDEAVADIYLKSLQSQKGKV